MVLPSRCIMWAFGAATGSCCEDFTTSSFWPAELLMTLKDCVETPRELRHRLNLIRLKTAPCFDINRLREYMPKENIDKVPYEKFTLHQMRQGEFPRPQSSHKTKIKILPVLLAATSTHQTHFVFVGSLKDNRGGSKSKTSVRPQRRRQHFNRLWIIKALLTSLLKTNWVLCLVQSCDTKTHILHLQ